jgi:hypothetical protein
MAKNKAEDFLAGLSMEMVVPATPLEAESGDAVVCGPDSYFPDDIRTFCAECGEAIVHRPHAPAGARKICMGCAHTLIAADDNPVIMATEQTLKEVKAFILRKKGAQ